MHSVTEDTYKTIMECFKDCIDRFKYINKAVDSLFKNLNSKSIQSMQPEDILKLYNNTYSMQIKAMEMADRMLSKFPSELTPAEYEMLELFRALPETSKYDIVRLMKGIINGSIQ